MTGGQGLANFIRTYPTLKAYSLLPIAGTTNILAIVRTGDAQRAGSVAPTTVPPHPSEARYHYRFWAAFSVPWTGGRYLDPEIFIFKDLSDTEEPAEGWI